MSSSDREELLRLAKENIELQRLVKKHEGFEEKLRIIQKGKVLSAQESIEVKKLKIQKLKNKDEMARLVREIQASRREQRPNKTPPLLREVELAAAYSGF